jgi:hypothetical protein
VFCGRKGKVRRGGREIGEESETFQHDLDDASRGGGERKRGERRVKHFNMIWMMPVEVEERGREERGE